jgi:hypothetical protein
MQEEYLWAGSKAALHSNSSSTNGTTNSTAAAVSAAVIEATPRFTLLIVDALPPAAAAAQMPCAVVLIPRGREHEFAFASAEGLRAVAASASTARLIAVRLNRGHEFTDHDAGKLTITLLVHSTCTTH